MCVCCVCIAFVWRMHEHTHAHAFTHTPRRPRRAGRSMRALLPAPLATFGLLGVAAPPEKSSPSRKNSRSNLLAPPPEPPADEDDARQGQDQGHGQQGQQGPGGAQEAGLQGAGDRADPFAKPAGAYWISNSVFGRHFALHLALMSTLPPLGLADPFAKPAVRAVYHPPSAPMAKQAAVVQGVAEPFHMVRD